MRRRRLVNVYFETVVGYPSLFKSRVFFVFFRFSFSFCFRLRLSHSDPSMIIRREREREPPKKTMFFSLPVWTNTYRMQKKSYNLKDLTKNLLSCRTKTALCDCILSMYSFIVGRRFALSSFSFHHIILLIVCD